jgi:acetyl esterase/lipase
MAVATTAFAEPATTQSAAAKVTVIEGIVFVDRDGTELKLDMARPDGEGPFPVIVCLYGGGWVSGGRTAMRSRIEYVASHGYVAVAPDYRLAPAHPFPAAVADVRECVRWVRRHAKEHDLDPRRVGAMGLSAGGHLACMLGVTSDTDDFGADDASPDKTSARVRAVVNYFGPGDLAADDWSELAVRKYLVPFLQGRADEKPEAYRQASPNHYISADDPPLLTFQGDADRTVPVAQAIKLHQLLDEEGVVNELVILEGKGHGWGEPDRTRTRRLMMKFFDRHLAKSASTDGKQPS